MQSFEINITHNTWIESEPSILREDMVQELNTEQTMNDTDEKQTLKMTRETIIIYFYSKQSTF